MKITHIDSLLEEHGALNSQKMPDVDDDSLEQFIMDNSQEIDERIKALEKYYALVGDQVIELIRSLGSNYQLSGLKIYEKLFSKICTHTNLSTMLRLEAAKNLLLYEEQELVSSETDELQKENNEKLRIRNLARKTTGYEALDCVCYDLSEVPTPCRFEAICLLMKSEKHTTNVHAYFREFIRDPNIDCDFRYKSILSLENIGCEMMKSKLRESFEFPGLVAGIYKDYAFEIKKAFPGVTISPKNYRFFSTVLNNLSYDKIRDVFKKNFPTEPAGLEIYIDKAMYAFLFWKPNMTFYRILAGQYLLIKSNSLTEQNRFKIENEILSFAKDDKLDYDRRADAADVLLRLGSASMKQHGRDVIKELGKVGGLVRSVFDDAQNVHNEEVESSVVEALEFLSNIPLMQVKGSPITFEYVNNQVNEMLKEERESMKLDGTGKEYCDHCESPIVDKVIIEDHKFCSDDCNRYYTRDEKIKLAMNRIYMDRARYSKFASTLVAILLKIWTFIMSHKTAKNELKKRLLEELEEMSGTCSSGFASRMINVLSGYSDYSVRISWEDQISANFSGRLNAAARHITDKYSPFYSKYLLDVVDLWLCSPNNKELEERVIKDYLPRVVKIDVEYGIEMVKYTKELVRKDVINFYLETDKDTKVQECVDTFAENVFNEMTVTSSKHADRRNFALFFRATAPAIQDEIHREFKEYLDQTSIDLYLRKSMIHYGC